MSKFLLVTSDSEAFDGKTVPACDIALARLKNNIWPLYANTKNKNYIQKGHFCLFYLGGDKKHKQTVIARAKVKEIRPFKKNDTVDDFVINDIPEKIIVLENTEIFNSPIQFKLLILDLKFIKKMKHWGLMMMGGCRVIPDEDYELILSKLSQ